MEDNELVKKAIDEAPEPGRNRYGRAVRDRLSEYSQVALNKGQIDFRSFTKMENRLNKGLPLDEEFLIKIGLAINPRVITGQLALDQLQKSFRGD